MLEVGLPPAVATPTTYVKRLRTAEGSEESEAT